MTIDLNYRSLQDAIIKSYTSGDLDNSMNQQVESLKMLARLYDPKLFHNGNIRATRVRLLTEVQSKVDKIIERKIFNVMKE